MTDPRSPLEEALRIAIVFYEGPLDVHLPVHGSAVEALSANIDALAAHIARFLSTVTDTDEGPMTRTVDERLAAALCASRPPEVPDGVPLHVDDECRVLGRRVIAALAEGFDAIHASPPCQFYTRLRTLPWLKDKEYWRSIPPTMAAVQATGLPWCVENVDSRASKTDLGSAWTLCGTMFGLRWDDGRPLYRHRLFAMSDFMLAPAHPKHDKVLVPGPLLKDRGRLNNGYVIGGHQNGLRAMGAMGIDWMTGNELSQAIPPAYTEFLGRQLLHAIEQAA